MEMYLIEARTRDKSNYHLGLAIEIGSEHLTSEPTFLYNKEGNIFSHKFVGDKLPLSTTSKFQFLSHVICPFGQVLTAISV